MATEKSTDKPAAKAAKPAKPAAPKAPKAAVAAPAKAVKAAKPVKAAKAAPGKQVKVTQIGSPIGRPANQRATLIGLGLNKLHRSRVLEDTPSIRGMIYKVHHLVKVEAVG